MVGHKRERVLGRVGRAVNAAARDFAREAAQLENGGGREAAVFVYCRDRPYAQTSLTLALALARPGSFSGPFFWRPISSFGLG